MRVQIDNVIYLVTSVIEKDDEIIINTHDNNAISLPIKNPEQRLEFMNQLLVNGHARIINSNNE